MYILCNVQCALINKLNMSGYIKQITFKQDIKCKTICKKTYKPDDKDQMKKLDFLKNGIALNYENHWYVHHVTKGIMLKGILKRVQTVH